METLLNTDTITSNQNLRGLRQLYDDVESHIAVGEELTARERTLNAANLVMPRCSQDRSRSTTTTAILSELLLLPGSSLLIGLLKGCRRIIAETDSSN